MFVVNGDMFGRYVKIPHVLAEKGEKFIFKVVGGLQSNAYCSIPIGLGAKDEIQGAEIVDVLHVIQCGVDETKVLTVALKDCELVEPRTNADRIRSMADDELAIFLVKVNSTHAKCRKGQAVCKWEDYPTHDKGCKDCFKEWLESEVEE